MKQEIMMDEPPRLWLTVRYTARYENLFAEIEKTPEKIFSAHGGGFRLRL